MIPIGTCVSDPDFVWKPAFPAPRPAVVYREEVMRAPASASRNARPARGRDRGPQRTARVNAERWEVAGSSLRARAGAEPEERMRLISFSMTTAAFLEGRKSVTRRVGWKNVRPGDRLMAIEKGQGLKKGEKVRRLGEIEVVSVRRERLDAITAEDVAREGLDGATTPDEFIRRFAEGNKFARGDTQITRIEFRKVEAMAPGCEPPKREGEPCSS